MSTETLVRRAFDAFKDEASSPPPMTLRGGSAVDGYDFAEPYDPAADQPTDEYLEGFGYWGITHLDGRSWRHYLPRLIQYALSHPDDPRMVVDSLVSSLRPPDRYPPRLATLTNAQEAIVREFLELLAFDERPDGVQEEAQQALEEWWLPNPRSRPAPEAIAAMRAAPMDYKTVGGGGYRLSVPVPLVGSEPRDIPSESRRVQTWGGFMCGDVHTIVAVNMTPVSAGSFRDVVAQRRRGFDYRSKPPKASPREPVRIDVPGARQAVRFDGAISGDSPAEPQHLSLLIADARDEIALLTVRSWPRDDAIREVDRIVRSFEIIKS